MDFSERFKTAAFKIKHKESGRELEAIVIETKLVRVPLTIGDRPSFQDVERDIIDPKTKKAVDKVKDKAKCFDFGAGDSHGGMVSAEAGDYLVRDGHTYFVVPDIDKRTRKPIFSERYVRL